jgi:hypothetical protein
MEPMDLTTLAEHYGATNGPHAVLMVNGQAVALAMRRSKNCQAPSLEKSDTGEFWGSGGALQLVENTALSLAQNPLPVWVMEDLTGGNLYNYLGTYSRAGITTDQQRLEEASFMRGDNREPVVKIFNLRLVQQS